MLACPVGVQLLSESYAVLIYAAMESNPPDVDVAKTLYGAVSGTDTDPQLPWSTLCRYVLGEVWPHLLSNMLLSLNGGWVRLGCVCLTGLCPAWNSDIVAWLGSPVHLCTVLRCVRYGYVYLLLCRLLASKGFAADAVSAVKEGLRAGREMDGDVAEAYLKGLCDTEQLVRG